MHYGEGNRRPRLRLLPPLSLHIWQVRKSGAERGPARPFLPCPGFWSGLKTREIVLNQVGSAEHLPEYFPSSRSEKFSWSPGNKSATGHPKKDKIERARWSVREFVRIDGTACVTGERGTRAVTSYALIRLIECIG